MSVRAEKTGNYTPASGRKRGPTHMDPDLLEQIMSDRETIRRLRAGHPIRERSGKPRLVTVLCRTCGKPCRRSDGQCWECWLKTSEGRVYRRKLDKEHRARMKTKESIA